VFLSDGSSKNTKKNVLQKSPVETFLQKKRPKIQNRLLLDFFYHVFWAFLGEGSSKTPLKKYRGKTDLGPFLASIVPTHHGVTEKKMGGPLRLRLLLLKHLNDQKKKAAPPHDLA
jgi:hypothetical protein